MTEDQVHDCRRLLLDLIDLFCLDARVIQSLRRAARRIDRVAERLKTPSDLDRLALVRILHRDDHAPVPGQVDPGAEKRFVQRLVKGFCDAKTLPCGLHLRSEADLGAPDLLEGEHGHLDCDIVRLLLQPWLIPELPDRLSDDDLRGEIHDRDPCHLADVGNSPRGAGIHLDHKHFLADSNELDVDQPLHMQCFREPSRVLRDRLLHLVRDRVRGVDRDRVAGVNSCSLYVLHDPRDQDVRAVAYSVHLQLLALQVLVDEDRVILRDAVDDLHELLDLLVGQRDLHPLSAKHVRRSDKHWISQAVCDRLCLLRRVDRAARRARDLRLFEDPVKQLPVLRGVDVLRLRPEDRHTHLHQALCELDRRLSAKLHHRPVRLLDVDDVLHVLRRERLKVELVRNIKVRAHRLGIVVDDDRLVACL